MLEYINNWYKRYFTDPQAALLVILLALGFVVLYFFGPMLTPLLAAIIIAYMLEGPVQKLTRGKIPRIVSVTIVFLVFVLFSSFIVVGLLPILSRQASQFFQELPGMITRGQELLLRLPQQYPDIIPVEMVTEIGVALRAGLSEIGQNILSFSVASIPAIVTLLVYLILVPLMIFFFLKDKTQITVWLSRFLPGERALISDIWHEMDEQIGNYIRGKVYEIIIVGAAAYMVFAVLGLSYAPLLAIVVGLSVLVPYIGAAAVTLPVALIGYFQWGLDTPFIWLMLSYFVLQFLDGNVLVPILFSDVVSLHPVAIIVAILIFGGLWGFWGVFFAIPLATFVKALLNAWPARED